MRKQKWSWWLLCFASLTLFVFLCYSLFYWGHSGTRQVFHRSAPGLLRVQPLAVFGDDWDGRVIDEKPFDDQSQDDDRNQDDDQGQNDGQEHDDGQGQNDDQADNQGQNDGQEHDDDQGQNDGQEHDDQDQDGDQDHNDGSKPPPDDEPPDDRDPPVSVELLSPDDSGAALVEIRDTLRIMLGLLLAVAACFVVKLILYPFRFLLYY